VLVEVAFIQLKPDILLVEDEAECCGEGELFNLWPHAAHYSNIFWREDCCFPPAVPGGGLYQVAKHTAAAAQRYQGQNLHQP